MQSFKIQSFEYFSRKYMTQLKEPVCVPACLAELCGGWHQQTFKQVMNKLSKNKTAPFPLYFSAVEAMELISHKRATLKQIFAMMDTRNVKRIDGMELYTMFLLLAKADYDSVLKCAVDVFGVEEVGCISKGELFFFIDSMFRGFSKTLILRGDAAPVKVNVRLDCQEISNFVTKMMGTKTSISKNEICEAFEAVQNLNALLKYVHLRVSMSADWAREESIRNMKIQMEVKAVMRGFYEQVEKRLKAGK